MKYTVVWSKEAEAQLTMVWLGSRARQLINETSNGIDSMLSVNPSEVGESRPNGARIAHIAPVGVLFGQDPNIHDEHKTRIPDGIDQLLFLRIPSVRAEEK